MFDIIDLGDVPIAGAVLNEVVTRYRDLERARLAHETVRALIDLMVQDLLGESRRRIEKLPAGSLEDIRAADQPVIAFSSQMDQHNKALKKFLHTRMYKHDRVVAMMERAQRLLSDLFESYMAQPDLLPLSWRPEDGKPGDSAHARRVCDFVAGMTDRFALDEHRRLFELDRQFR